LNNEVYVKRSEPFGSYTRVTNNSASDQYPAWAPWGDTIVFSSDRNDANSEIYTVKTDGTDLFRLTHSSSDDIHPDW